MSLKPEIKVGLENLRPKYDRKRVKVDLGDEDVRKSLREAVADTREWLKEVEARQPDLLQQPKVKILKQVFQESAVEKKEEPPSGSPPSEGAPVEGSLSELVRAHGARRSRYRGLKRVGLRGLFLGAMLNVKRWVKAIVIGWQPQAQAAGR